MTETCCGISWIAETRENLKRPNKHRFYYNIKILSYFLAHTKNFAAVQDCIHQLRQ